MLDDLVRIGGPLLILAAGAGAVTLGWYRGEREHALNQKDFAEQTHTKALLSTHYGRDFSTATPTMLQQDSADLRVQFDLDDMRYLARFQRIPLFSLMSLTRTPDEAYVLLETQAYPRADRSFE